MRLPLCPVLLIIALSGPCLGAVADAVAANPKVADVPVRKVYLFSSGVGYFEHAGTVAGATATELRFKVGQINDILKSLLLEDLDGGKVGTVDYPSLDPLEKTLKSFQVDITQNPSLAQLLNQLRGAAITVSIQTEKVAGTIVGVERRVKTVGDKGQTIEYWVLNLLTGSTIRQLPLDDVQGLALEDQQLQAELHRALAALTQARDQDKKPVVIRFEGQGNRRVRLGYVIETPVWKTSYRLVMPAKGAQQGNLQGWAIVENQTDNDWNDVQLSLVSGRPISFVQDLYRPLYVPRPTVEPELYASLRPQTYGGGMERKEALARDKGLGGRREEAKAQEMAMAAPSAARKARGVGGMAGDANALIDMEQSDGPIDAIASVTSAAAAERLGELFQYAVPAVTLPRQRSAMLPIVTDPIAIERVSIFNLNVLANHPLNGAMLTNTTGKHLLQGPVTVLDGGGYAGDASLDNLPPGDHRLLSFAIDIPVRVDATTDSDERKVITGKILDGALQVTSKLIATREYRFDNTADDDRTIVIEHALRSGWTLAGETKPFETTPQLYRFKLTVLAKQQAKQSVIEEFVQVEALALVDMEPTMIDFYVSTGAIPQPVRDALAVAAKMKHDLVDLQRRIDLRQQEITTIVNDQNRLRENMRTVAQNSQYYQRLLTKLNDQETQVEAKQTELDKLRAAFEDKRRELTAYLEHLKAG
jgi:hypothetical protein